NPESAPAEPSFEDLISQFERETAAVAEPVPEAEPILGATQAPDEQAPQPEPQPSILDRILADNLLPAELRHEAEMFRAERQQQARENDWRDFCQSYTDLATSLAKGFPHFNPELVNTIVAGRLFQLANSDPAVVRAFDNRVANPRLYQAA